MGQKISWLMEFWKREWKRCKKDWIRMVYIEVACVCAVCVLFVLQRTRMDRFVEYTLNMPSAIYAFWGIHPDVAPGKASFYVQWAMMPLHVWIAWKICNGMIRSLWMEEEQGTIFFLCNQWYSRQQIILAKYLWNVLKFIVGYFALFIACVALAGNGWGIKRLAGLFARGLPVLILFLSVSCCYAVFSRRKSEGFWTDILVFGTLAAGNLYKLRDLFILLLQRANRGYGGLYRMTGWLDGLRWISPLSWLNPYTQYGVRDTVVQMVICIAGIAVSVAISLQGYRIRRFE